MAQLNSLLFSVHGLSDKSLELNIQGQLAAIYSRLQEIVAMINVAKKKETKTKVGCSSPADSVARPVSDEQKINKKFKNVYLLPISMVCYNILDSSCFYNRH